MALHEALNALQAVDPRKARIVELHYFGGLTVAETAELLACSVSTVSRDWRMAKAWLRAKLDPRRLVDDGRRVVACLLV